jgi:hypothetical protein
VSDSAGDASVRMATVLLELLVILWLVWMLVYCPLVRRVAGNSDGIGKTTAQGCSDVTGT